MRARIAWIVVVAVAATVFVAATHQLPTGSLAFTAPGDSVVVPFLFRNNHVLVRGTIGNSDSLWFIVDSGAGSHCVNRSTADRLHIPVGGGVSALGSGGEVPAGAAHDLTYRVAGVKVDAPFVAAIDLDPVALQLGGPVDGILGEPLFQNAVVTVDYDKGQLVLHPKSFKPPGAGLALSFKDNHPYVAGKLTLPGQKPDAGSFMLDTGSALALVLEPEFVAKSHAVQSVTKTIELRLGGVGGQSFHPCGRIERLELGPYALDRPVAVLSKAGPGHTSAPGTIGNIGGDVLQRFRVTFDYPHARLYLAPGGTFARPFEADMTGLTLAVQPAGAHAIAVLKVEPGSPAQERGIVAGDVVEAVDGRPLVAADMAALRKRMKREGEELRLGLLRGTTRSEVILTTRRMI